MRHCSRLRMNSTMPWKIGRVNEAHDGTRIPTTGIPLLPGNFPIGFACHRLGQAAHSLMVTGRSSRFFNSACMAVSINCRSGSIRTASPAAHRRCRGASFHRVMARLARRARSGSGAMKSNSNVPKPGCFLRLSLAMWRTTPYGSSSSRARCGASQPPPEASRAGCQPACHAAMARWAAWPFEQPKQRGGGAPLLGAQRQRLVAVALGQMLLRPVERLVEVAEVAGVRYAVANAAPG